jgi:hypothetical protein
MDTLEKLNLLAEYQSQKDAAMLEEQSLIDSILTSEIKAQIADIKAEFTERTAAVSANLATLEAEIKSDVLTHGATVKGIYFQAVWSKARVSWNTVALDAYALSHPELNQFRSEGSPSVSLRVVKS